MTKHIPPKNTPFKDLLSDFREKLISKKRDELHNQNIRIPQSTQKSHHKSPEHLDSKQRKNSNSNRIINRIISSNQPEPPIIIRRIVQSKQNDPPKKITKMNSTQEPITITEIPNPSIEFSWINNKNKIDFQFNYQKGKQFQPTKYSDDEIREIAIGFDFGTSSSKITIRDRQAGNSFAISFSQSSGVDRYLLPSKIYQRGTSFSLDSGDKEFSSLKIRVISSSPSNEDILATVAYFALVIRHARSQFFSQYDNNYRGQCFIWRLNVGIPARTVQKFEIKKRILDICRAAFICSYGDNDIVLLSDAQHVLDIISNENFSTHFNNLPKELQISFGNSYDVFLEEGIQIYPEIMAQIHGFVRSNAWNPESNPHILMIDIGAGTLDISLCDVVKNIDSVYSYYPLACVVEGLGVSNFVKSRIDKVFELANSLPSEQQESILQTLLCLDNINYGRISVPSSLKEMFEGFKFSIENSEERFDSEFKRLICSVLYKKTTYEASKTYLPGDSTWKPFPVFVCGGGSRMDFYKNIIKFYSKNDSYHARFDIKELPKPKDLFNLKDNLIDYDRLSVSYGLGYWDLGEFLADFESPKIEILGDESSVWTDKFISKDIV